MADKRLIPGGIRDISTEALNELIERFGSLDLTKLLIYIIDHVDPSVLHHLAWQFHIEGYEITQTIEEKRKLIKKAIELHRHKGTKWAIENALKACGYESYVKEWFEYNDQPYLFKVYTKKIINNEQIYINLINTIKEYKNERSWLSSIGTHHEHELKFFVGAKVWQGHIYNIPPNVPDFYVQPITKKAGLCFRIGNHISIGASSG